MKIVNYLKKLFIILFTRNPYKIVPFDCLIKEDIGSPVSTPETLTSILIKEEGKLIFYPPYPQSYDQTLLEQKLNSESQYSTGTIFREADRYLYSLDRGHIIGFLGLIYDKKSRSFIDESARIWDTNLTKSNCINFYFPPLPIYLPGVTLSFITIGADGGFYHFFHEVLPKFFFCRDVLPNVDHILLNGPAVEWKEKWLRYMQIDLKKIIWIDNLTHFVCKQLLFTNRLITGQQISPWSINALKFLLNLSSQAQPSKQKRIIWLTRKNVFDRTIAWEDELLNKFPEIEKFDLRDLSVEDTLKIFKSASHVIGAHGAGLSNLLICTPGTKVLELYPDLYDYQPCYFRISSLCGLQHFVAEVNFNSIKGMQACNELLNEFI